MHRKHPSGIFMMEMIAVIFFFILCSGICIKTFVSADFMSREAADLNQGVLIAQSVAEVWKGSGLEEFEKRFKAYRPENDSESYAMGFDEAGNPCEKDKAVFGVRAEITGSEQMEVTVSRNRNYVYSLTVNRHETKH